MHCIKGSFLTLLILKLQNQLMKLFFYVYELTYKFLKIISCRVSSQGEFSCVCSGHPTGRMLSSTENNCKASPQYAALYVSSGYEKKWKLEDILYIYRAFRQNELVNVAVLCSYLQRPCCTGNNYMASPLCEPYYDVLPDMPEQTSFHKQYSCRVSLPCGF